MLFDHNAAITSVSLRTTSKVRTFCDWCIYLRVHGKLGPLTLVGVSCVQRAVPTEVKVFSLFSVCSLQGRETKV